MNKNKKIYILFVVFIGIILLFNVLMYKTDNSPPMFAITYKKVGKIIKVTPYDKVSSWYKTEEDTFLFPNENNGISPSMYMVSKWDKVYCVPSYCSKLLGLNGKIDI
ncbi:hypothetical protein GW796_06435 [archaeon]|nr:hypothetical protein [archaeon]